MSYTLVFSSESVKDIKKLDTVIIKRLQKKFIEFSKVDDITKVAKKLINFNAGEYRLRFGDYRIIFDLHGNTIFILRVRYRREVYK